MIIGRNKNSNAMPMVQPDGNDCLSEYGSDDDSSMTMIVFLKVVIFVMMSESLKS